MQPNFDSQLGPNRLLTELHRHIDSTFDYFSVKGQPNLERLNASIHNLAMTLNTVIKDFQSRNISDEQYGSIRDKLKKLNDNYSSKHPSIKSIFDACEKGLNPRSVSPVTLLYQAASWAGGFLPQSFQNQFCDVNHPWKQKKYELAMKLIAEASHKHRDNLLTTYNRLDSFSDFELPLRCPTMEVLRLLLDMPIVMPDMARNQSQLFLTKLREILTSRTFEIELTRKTEFDKLVAQGSLNAELKQYDCCVDELLWLCWFRFTEVHLFPFCKKVVELMIAEGKALQSTQDKPKPILLSEILEDDFQNIKAAPLQAPNIATNTQKLKGTLNIGFDPHGSSNIPYVLYNLAYNSGATVKNVTALRIGTPTRQRYDSRTMTYQGEAEIVPEFDKFIFLMKSFKKKILDISLQEDVERTVCTESERSRTLRSYHQKHPENFLLIILSQDSDFYYQRGMFSAPNKNATEFKSSFLLEMTSPWNNRGFFFPEVWRKDAAFENELKRLLDVVHKDVFGNAAMLTLRQRQDFIEIYYARLAMFAIMYSGADFFFMCCKDSADRAPKLNAIFFYINMLMLRKETDPTYLTIFRVNVHAAAMLVKKGAMNHDRRVRLISAIQQLEKPEVIENIRNWAAEFPITGDIIVQMPPGQDV